MNIRTSAKMQEKRSEQRLLVWPNLDERLLWSRKRSKGFTTIPRTLPLIFRIMDGLSRSKPLSPTYLALWCQAWDEMHIVAENPTLHAYQAGFGGERKGNTWISRVRRLRELGFIRTEAGPAGDCHHILLLNPMLVVWQLSKQNPPGFDVVAYRELRQYATKIKAKDIDEIEAREKEMPSPASPRRSAPKAKK